MLEFRWRGQGGLSPGKAESNSLFLRMHLAGLSELGVDIDALLPRWGVPRSALAQMPDWVDQVWSDRLWQAAEQITDDAYIGLRLAHRNHTDLDELVGSVVRRSRNLGAALDQLCRFGPVLDTRLDFRLEFEGDLAVVAQRPSPGPVPMRQPTEYVMGVLALIGRQLTAVPLRALEVHFRHGAPDDLEGLRRHLGDRLHFDGLDNALVIDRDLLDIPIIRELDDESVLRLRRESDALQRALPDDGFLKQVRAVVESALCSGAPGGAQVARALGLGEPELRARLRVRGTSLRLLTDSVRHALALRYLHDSRLPIGEVARRLGYHDPIAFRRAFRRWVGCTPQEYLVTH